jgi:hypothetical protein
MGLRSLIRKNEKGKMKRTDHTIFFVRFSLFVFRLLVHYPFSYARPNARGGRECPIKPASTTIVST